MYMARSFLPLSFAVSAVLNLTGFSLVEHTLLRMWFVWPFAVSIVAGEYYLIFSQ